MKAVVVSASAIALLAVSARAVTLPLVTKCPPDAVLVGALCVDKYEASVWQIPAINSSGKTNAGLINKIKKGTVKSTDLTAGLAVDFSPGGSAGGCSPAFPVTFPNNGQWTQPLYAVSISGVLPTACITWFQAEQACAASGKRLLTNQEWQRAAAGTAEGALGDDGSTQCNTLTAGDVVETGKRTACVSNYGAYDMVGNVDEWVADWVPQSTTCASWSGSSDLQCLAGAATWAEPGALIRGGGSFDGASAGPFSVDGRVSPSYSDAFVGFRCAR